MPRTIYVMNFPFAMYCLMSSASKEESKHVYSTYEGCGRRRLFG